MGKQVPQRLRMRLFESGRGAILLMCRLARWFTARLAEIHSMAGQALGNGLA